MAYEQEKETAVEAVREAAALCRTVQAALVDGNAMQKSDRSPVTVADFGSQALVCRRLQSVFKDDPIVGEEDASALREAGQEAMREAVCDYVGQFVEGADCERILEWIDAGNGEVGPRYWTLDPIDGTKGFLRGDQYAVALALVEDGQVKVAALACPVLPADLHDPEGELGVLMLAVRGQGTVVMPLAGEEARAVHVAREREQEAWRFVESVEASHSDHERQEAVARAVGIQAASLRMDSQTKYAAVARGDAALYLRLPSPDQPDYREKIWDHAAGSLVVEEAGGQVSDMTGAPLDFGSDSRMKSRGVVVSSGPIHKQVIEVLKQV